jgi:hypothetical protein
MAYVFNPSWWVDAADRAGIYPSVRIKADGSRWLEVKVNIDSRYDPPSLIASDERAAVVEELIRRGRARGQVLEFTGKRLPIRRRRAPA